MQDRLRLRLDDSGAGGEQLSRDEDDAGIRSGGLRRAPDRAGPGTGGADERGRSRVPLRRKVLAEDPCDRPERERDEPRVLRPGGDRGQPPRG